MTDEMWVTGSGLARAMLADRPTVVLQAPGTGQAQLATVDGKTFQDLPELLGAAQGLPSRIRAGSPVVLSEADMLSPVGRPRKIICAGRNYTEHVAEAGHGSVSSYPDLFPKWDNALAGPYADLPLPPESSQVDFECELAVVIGRRCRRVATAEVPDVVFGYTVANDGSVRDYQFHASQAAPGKAWDALTPLGPVVVPAGELGGVNPDLRISGRLNGEIMQDDRTSSMVHSVPELIAYISTFLTLEPGDLILTGTPAGVGAVRQPPRYLRDGDEFEARIEGIGSLRNRYHAEKTE